MSEESKEAPVDPDPQDLLERAIDDGTYDEAAAAESIDRDRKVVTDGTTAAAGVTPLEAGDR